MRNCCHRPRGKHLQTVWRNKRMLQLRWTVEPFRIYNFEAVTAQSSWDTTKHTNSVQIMPIRSLRADVMFSVSLFKSNPLWPKLCIKSGLFFRLFGSKVGHSSSTLNETTCPQSLFLPICPSVMTGASTLRRRLSADPHSLIPLEQRNSLYYP